MSVLEKFRGGREWVHRRELVHHHYIKNHIIDRVSVTKFLGILIDEGLNWKEHINLIKSKLSKTVSIVGRCKNILDKEALYILYCTLFLPYI